jgi:LysM repeat protein
MRNWLSAIAMAAIMPFSPAQAAVIVNVQEVGADVVINFSGTIDPTGLGTGAYSGGTNRFVRPEFGMVVSVYFEGWNYSYVTPNAPHGPGEATGAATYTTTQSGDSFSVSQYGVIVPYLYQTNTALSGSMTFLGTTLFLLGYTPGVYVTTLPNDTITTNVIASAVPLPAAAPLLLGALALTGFAARRRKG